MYNLKRAFIAVLLLLSLAVTANAHPGKLDENGGHYDSKTGKYHYHKGPKAGTDRLLLEGYAQTMTIQPNVRYSEMFVKFQREAREAEKGLWK